MVTAQATQSERPVASRMPVYLVAWRAVIAGVAWWGLSAAVKWDFTSLRYFSQVSTLTVALAMTASVAGFPVRSERWDRAMAWCRGAATSYAIVTAIIYQTLLSGFLGSTSSVLEHAVVPTLAVIDWVAFGPGRVRQRWWVVLTWLILPTCYLAVYYRQRVRGRPLYAFFDPRAADFWWPWVAIMSGIFLLAGVAVLLVGLLRSRGARTAQVHNNG